jgi:hypothetical protein
MTCPRYYQSIARLGKAGLNTEIPDKDDKKLSEMWRNSPLWPTIQEQAVSISGPNNSNTHFWNFCPEVAFDRFGYFASDLDRYADEISLLRALLRWIRSLK